MCIRDSSKGVPEWEVIGKYALKNSVLPVVTYVGPLVAALLTGTFIIEKLFSIPGLGRYFISAITDRDYSVTLGLTVFLGVMIIGCNLIVDIMYAVDVYKRQPWCPAARSTGNRSLPPGL